MSVSRKPLVICADRFYMTDEAMHVLENAGSVMWFEGKSETEFVEKVTETTPKVIIAEYFKITDRLMDASPNLKGIVVWGVGYDHIDVEAASQRGIYVANARGANAESVAEHAFSLLINLSRNLLQVDRYVREGKWKGFPPLPEELIGIDLYEKTLGIVGLGNIGNRVARIAHGFNMRVLAYDPYISVEQARKAGAELVTLEKLLMESDFVTIHVALTKETRGLIGVRKLELIKPTAYLINTSRGAVFEEEALIKALKEKRIAGAGLDVFTKEPLNSDSPLLKFDNVIVTPHCAGISEEALSATSLTVAQEAVRMISNQIPKNLVNERQLKEKGYSS